MRDRSDRYRVQTVPTVASVRKRLGSYLVEAGLLTTAQLDVALKDQKMTEQSTGTRMQLGEIIAARGWLKEQTIEYLMQKVVLPERQAFDGHGSNAALRQNSQDASRQQKVNAESNQRPAQGVSRSATSAQPGKAQPASSGQSSFSRREIPIAKPLPPVNSSDNDVNWVG